MANKTRFAIAESNIKSFFKNDSKKVFSISELGEVFEQKRLLWKLPMSMNLEKFVDKLISSAIIVKQEIQFTGYIGRKERYLSSTASVFQIAISLMNKSYLSHYSAVFLHGLSTQIPKTVYLSFEQSRKDRERELEQPAIDSAFSKPQRKSNSTTLYEGYTILMHNSMYSNRAGIYTLNDLPTTNIERTLIDIAVRPDYAGGVHSVLGIYKNAIPRISINKLVAILDNLDFIYPYHQSIGFYLEKAGVSDSKLKLLSSKKKEFDFYLTYEISEKLYNSKWKLYYPKGL